jgi:hypothetical protein
VTVVCRLTPIIFPFTLILLGLPTSQFLAADTAPLATAPSIAIDPWCAGGAGGSVSIRIPVPAAAEPLSIAVEGPAGAIECRVPGAAGEGTIDIPAAALIDPWSGAGGTVRWTIAAPAGDVATGAAELRALTARESIDRLARAVLEAETPLARAEARLRATEALLELGQAASAEGEVAALRADAPALTAADPERAAAIGLARVLLEARIQRSFADADPEHRRAAEDRLDRIGDAVAAHPELAAGRALLLAEAELERLPFAADAAERRRSLDRARDHARIVRAKAREAESRERAELLWARVAVERGWKTEARDTLGRLETDADPRLAARAATLRSRLAALEGDVEAETRSLGRALLACDRARDRLGDAALEGGFLANFREPYRLAARAAAARGDAAGRRSSAPARAPLPARRARSTSRSCASGSATGRRSSPSPRWGTPSSRSGSMRGRPRSARSRARPARPRSGLPPWCGPAARMPPPPPGSPSASSSPTRRRSRRGSSSCPPGRSGRSPTTPSASRGATSARGTRSRRSPPSRRCSARLQPPTLPGSRSSTLRPTTTTTGPPTAPPSPRRAPMPSRGRISAAMSFFGRGWRRRRRACAPTEARPG